VLHIYIGGNATNFLKEGWYQKGICAHDAENLLKS
jgi:hypothetical protein